VVLRTSNDGIESLEQITEASNSGTENLMFSVPLLMASVICAKLSILSFDVLSTTVNGLCDLFSAFYSII
jgi:hypothetical protein